MHDKPMADHEGTFAPEGPTRYRCRRCKRDTVKVERWESHDEAYEDYRYTCEDPSCGHVWWVEGPDS